MDVWLKNNIVLAVGGEPPADADGLVSLEAAASCEPGWCWNGSTFDPVEKPGTLRQLVESLKASQNPDELAALRELQDLLTPEAAALLASLSGA